MRRKIAAAFLSILCVSGVIVIGFVGWTLTLRYERYIYTATDISKLSECPVALVFGAGYWPDGTPSDIMKDRVAAGVELLRAGKVRKLIFSGDNRFLNYNEPGKMCEYALSLGCPREAIVLDYAGRRTYDSCYRARDIFGQQQVILVTQRYHLPRALYVCEGLGIDAVGYVADCREYVHIREYWLREVPALLLAWVDRWVRHPLPVLGDPIQITRNVRREA